MSTRHDTKHNNRKTRTRPTIEELEAELIKKSFIKQYMDWLKQAVVLFKQRKFLFSALLLLTWAVLTLSVLAGMDVIRILFYFFKLYVL